MKKLGMLPNPEKDPRLKCSKKICAYLKKIGAQVYTLPEYADLAKDIHIVSKEELYQEVECIIAIGGDGTMLRVSHDAAKAKKPILGINFGKVGYMAELEYSEIEMLSALIEDKFSYDKRSMLDVVVMRNGKELYRSIALNDAVVTKGLVSRLVDIDIYSEKGFITSYKADGLIASTPTGSTGYSIAAGGPIIEPSSRSIIVTPIAPHSLVNRSIVFDDEAKITIVAKNIANKDAYLDVDGFENVRLQEGDEVVVSRSRKYTNLIKIKNLNFYEILNSKLGGNGGAKK